MRPRAPCARGRALNSRRHAGRGGRRSEIAAFVLPGLDLGLDVQRMRFAVPQHAGTPCHRRTARGARRNRGQDQPTLFDLQVTTPNEQLLTDGGFAGRIGAAQAPCAGRSRRRVRTGARQRRFAMRREGRPCGDARVGDAQGSVEDCRLSDRRNTVGAVTHARAAARLPRTRARCAHGAYAAAACTATTTRCVARSSTSATVPPAWTTPSSVILSGPWSTAPSTTCTTSIS